jgi:hypothetical protein
MSHRVRTSAGVLVMLVGGGTIAAVGAQTRSRASETAAVRTWTPPRTLEGRPDLQGIWVNNSATPLERPKALEGRASLSDEEVAELRARAGRIFDVNGPSDLAAGDEVFLAALANVTSYRSATATGTALAMPERRFETRTSLIVDPPDGRLPPITPEAQQKRAIAAALAPRLPDGPEDLNLIVRCITFGVPRLGGNAASYNPFHQIVQTSDYVVFIGESIHDARIIPLDGRPHLPDGIRQWHGDSRGRWDGDTLVVETTNFSSKGSFMRSSDRLHLTERFTRVADDTIDYAITIDDPTTWTRPWTAVVHLWRTGSKMFEYACNEGNYDTMASILAGARAEERAAGTGR